EHAEIDVVAQRNLLGVYAQDGFAALDIGASDHHAAIEAARTKQRRIKHVGAVRSGDEDHAFVGFEAVHFDQQLVERLLALIVSAAEAGAAMATDRVDFVDEDDAGRVLFTLLEQIADAARADADEHFDEVRTGDREERHAGFAGDRAGKQGLAGSWRSDQQDALGNASAELLKLLGLAQEFDDLLQLFFRLFNARYVFERDLFLLRGVQAR